MERFFLILHNKKVLHTLEDKIFLREAKGGLFLVSFVYQHLFDIEEKFFPPNSYGPLGCPPRWVSLCGRHLGAGYSLSIFLKEGIEP